MAAAPPSRSVLSLRQASFAQHGRSSVPVLLELDLLRGEIVLIEVADEEAAAALVDLCLGLADPELGEVSFLGVEWRTLAVHQRLDCRQRIGVVGETRVW